eukprot:6500618-Pyramimonas_sp.AAC.1
MAAVARREGTAGPRPWARAGGRTTASVQRVDTEWAGAGRDGGGQAGSARRAQSADVRKLPGARARNVSPVLSGGP